MKYFTAAEAGENWGITGRRVAQLASQGLIRGAIFKGNCWFIPADAQKPSDRRRKEAKAAEDVSQRYIFPFVLCCINSQEQVNAFTPEEAQLYRLCLVFEAGDFPGARQLAEELLQAENPYVQLGALYHLPVTCIYLRDFAAADRYTVMFRTAVSSFTEHRDELNLLLASFNSELDNFSDFASNMCTPDTDLISDELIPYISAFKLFSDFISLVNGSTVDFTVHEFNCRMTEAMGYFFAAMLMHLYLSASCSLNGDTKHELPHLRRATDIALEHGTVFSFSTLLAYSPQCFYDLAEEYPPEALKQFSEYSKLYVDSRNAYVEYRGKHTLLTRLSEDDYRLISFCMRKYSVERMAGVFGLSKSGMNRRLSALYDKLGVKSRRELENSFFSSVMNWCGEGQNSGAKR